MPSSHGCSALTPRPPLPLLWPLALSESPGHVCLPRTSSYPISALKDCTSLSITVQPLVKASSHKHSETSGKQTRTLEASVSQVVHWVELVGNTGMGPTLAMFPYFPFGF